MLSTLLLAVMISTVPVADDAMDHSRLEKMLEAGDEKLIIQTFKRYPDQVLPFIDEYLEGGLKMIEEGKDHQEALASFRLGVRFGEIATTAFRDDVFVDYAASFASWSPQEQQNFRLGQAEFKAGRKAKDDPHEALAHYQRSFDHATSLNDTWGEAMAAAGLAETHFALRDYVTAATHARTAGDLHRHLLFVDDQVEMYVLTARCLMQEDPKRGGFNELAAAWKLVEERPREDEIRKIVLPAYLEALDRLGRTADAAALRAMEAEAEATDESGS